MDTLSPESQNPITDPATTKANDQSKEEIKDETTMKNKKTKSSNLEKTKLNKEKKKEIMNNDEASSSSACSYSSYNSSSTTTTRRVSRVAHRLRNPTVRLGMPRRSVAERQAEALGRPLGISFAAFANLVLKRSNPAGQKVYVGDLAVISASAAKESLADVYGNKLGSFDTNFVRSFNNTLNILKVTAASPHQLGNNDVGTCNLDRSTIEGCSDTELSTKDTSPAMSANEVIQESATATSPMNELVLYEETRQLSGISRSSTMSLTLMERSVEEQARANDLKREENYLRKIELGMKAEDLDTRYVSNNLKKSKLEMGVTKFAFETEKFKTELEDSRKAEMVTRVMDWLVLSVFNMLGSMLLGVYFFSQQRIRDATSLCKPSDEKSSTSWWVPKQVSSINTELNMWICRLRVWVQLFFGVLMILVFTYFIIQRSSGTKQSMPVTFIVIFLGIVCGIPGKFCVDTFGGNGTLWLFFWEVFCLLQFVANVFTLALYGLMYGPVNVTEGARSSRCSTMVPYWARRSFLYVVFMFVLPVTSGLLPFATFGEWKDRFAEFIGGSGSQV